jgi:hypothetical protein
VEFYQKEMGWVDRHNRFRQDILGLHRVWKTKRWQTRIQLEMIGMALVDTFLLCRKFQVQWRPQESNSESAFWQFTRHLLPLLTPGNCNLSSSSSCAGTACVQVPIGKTAVKTSEKGRVGVRYTKQQRCKYCGMAGRKETRADGTVAANAKSPRTSYTCIRCPAAMCRESKGTCWAEHVAEARALALAGNEGDLEDSESE